ncbi:MAG: glycosyltransferase family 2 protein [Ktedonobacteraceae bacterium]
MKRSDHENIGSKYLSIIVPVYNEEENIPLLHKRLRAVLMQQQFSYEVLYIDDGSKDDTFAQLCHLLEDDEHVRVIRFRRNFGQTAAMSAGVAHSVGEILIFMDGDLQNDPLDIPRLLAKMDEGYDVVSGWRKDRQDAQWSRKFPSLLANKLIARVTGVYLHDYGCTLKAYRREVFKHIRLYGEMHRFIPAYAALVGAEIAELEVKHHARRFGKSKYGISRVVRVVLDLMTLKFLGSFGTRPMHLFGISGIASLALATTTLVYASGRHVLSSRRSAQRTPLGPTILLFSGFGLLSIMLGLLAELLTRTYHEAQDKPIYTLRQTLPHTLPGSDEMYDKDQHTTADYSNDWAGSIS